MAGVFLAFDLGVEVFLEPWRSHWEDRLRLGPEPRAGLIVAKVDPRQNGHGPVVPQAGFSRSPERRLRSRMAVSAPSYLPPFPRVSI